MTDDKRGDGRKWLPSSIHQRARTFYSTRSIRGRWTPGDSADSLLATTVKKKKKKVAGRSNCSGSSKSFISAAINGFLHVSHLLRRTPGLLQTPVSVFQCKIPIVSAHTYTYVSIPLFYSVLRANTHFSEHVITQRRLQTRRRSSFRLHQSQLHSAAGEKIIGLICILQENQDIEENKKQTK